MQTNQILSAPLIDIIFDGRNKDYGAYELRKTYSKRISKALLITCIVISCAVGGVVLANSGKKPPSKYKVTDGVVISDIEQKPPEKLPEQEKKPQQQVKTEIFIEPKVADNDKVENPPPTQDDLDKAAIGNEKRDGVDDNGIVDPGPGNIDNGPGIVEQRVPDPDEIVTFVEIEAKYPGNWKAFLERNLDANTPVDHNAPYGRYSVVVQFVVDKDGNVSDIHPLTNHGYGMEEEAVRVLKKATKWEPAIQNGFRVKAYRKQVIIFEINEEG